MPQIAVLDDYQDVAMSMADWGRLPVGCDVEVFHDHLSDEDALAKRLSDFEVVAAMRERMTFPRSLLERLPKLKLLITTGGRNASFDTAGAKERGVETRMFPHGGNNLEIGQPLRERVLIRQV